MNPIKLCILASVISCHSFAQVAAISGPPAICDGYTATYTDATSGGTWSSSNPAIAAIGSTSGIATGISNGVTTLSYTVGLSYATYTITVNPLPVAITGIPNVCVGATTLFTDATIGGMWSSSNSAVATIGTGGTIAGVSAGTTVIAYTLSTGCGVSKTVTVTATTAMHNVTGGGAYCSGGTGVVVGLDGSDPGASYQLYVGIIASGAPVIGTGAALSFGMQTVAGVYTVVANPGTSCAATMSGSATVTVNPLPTAYLVTGGGDYCIGGVGRDVALSASDPGIQYQLYISGMPVGAPFTGFGAMIDFGFYTTAGIYTVVATNTSTGCMATMTGSVTITVDPLPNVYAVTGGGSYCAGGSGLSIGLANSSAGVSYQLYLGTAAVGAAVAGTGSAISFGSQTAAGSYTIAATNVTTGCINTMSGSATITILPLPTFSSTLTPPAICDSTVFNYTPASTTPGTTFAWTRSVITGIPLPAGSGTGNPAEQLYNSTTSPISVPYTYTLTGGGCTNNQNVTVTVNGILAVTAAASSPACGGAVTLTGGGAATYTWAPGTGLSCTTCTTTTATPSSTIVYTVTGTDGSGCTNTATVSVDGNTISGHITYVGVSTDVFKVWLIQFNPIDSSITALDSVNSCMDSGIPYFEFMDPAPGNYLVKAKLNGTVPGTTGYIPTYSASTPNWYAATSLAHTSTSDVMNISMAYGTVPPGPGFISGFVYAGAGRGTSGDVPDPGILVYLEDASGHILTYTYTDVTGAYSFNGIANGSYIIYPEDYKYYTTPSSVINLTSSHEIVNAINFKRHTTLGVITPNTTSLLTVSSSEPVNYYPNPSKGIVNVANVASIAVGTYLAQTAEVTVTDLMGNTVYATTFPVDLHKQYTQLDLSNLGSGVYIINYRNEDIHFSGKLLIMR